MAKNGKIFGKINVIDFIVLLVIVVAIAAAAVFFLLPKEGNDTLVMKFRIEEVDEFVVDKVEKAFARGEKIALYDDTYSLDLGEVIDVEIDDSISYSQTDDENTYSITSKEGYKSMIITGELKGTKTNLGAEIGGKKYGVGHSFVLRAGDAKLYLRVYDIMLKEDYEKQQKELENEVKDFADVAITLYVPEINSDIASKLKSGTDVLDITRNNYLGTIAAENGIILGESESYDANNVLAPKEGYNSITIIFNSKAEKVKEEIKSDGKIIKEIENLVIEGKIYRSGDEITVAIGDTKLEALVMSVEEVQA